MYLPWFLPHEDEATVRYIEQCAVLGIAVPPQLAAVCRYGTVTSLEQAMQCPLPPDETPCVFTSETPLVIGIFAVLAVRVMGLPLATHAVRGQDMWSDQLTDASTPFGERALAMYLWFSNQIDNPFTKRKQNPS